MSPWPGDRILRCVDRRVGQLGVARTPRLPTPAYDSGPEQQPDGNRESSDKEPGGHEQQEDETGLAPPPMIEAVGRKTDYHLHGDEREGYGGGVPGDVKRITPGGHSTSMGLTPSPGKGTVSPNRCATGYVATANTATGVGDTERPPSLRESRSVGRDPRRHPAP